MTSTLLEWLNRLPAETEPSYGVTARELLRDPTATDSALTTVIENPSCAEQTRFNAFYCLQARAWRRKDYQAHRANTDRHQSIFGHHPMFYFMQAEYYASMSSDPANLDAALVFALESVQRLASVPGVLHLAAEIIADRYERDSDGDARLLLDGERFVRQAIALSHGEYPRYHATHARIATLRGDFTAARASIARAIEDEDSAGPEYALRIGDYQLIRARILHAQQARQLHDRQEEAAGELRRIRTQILEIMGLLAAVIAFITTAANIATSQPARPAGGLLTLTGGITLLVFWGFHVLLIGVGSPWRRMIPLVMGAILVLVGVVLTAEEPERAGGRSGQLVVETAQ